MILGSRFKNTAWTRRTSKTGLKRDPDKERTGTHAVFIRTLSQPDSVKSQISSLCQQVTSPILVVHDRAKQRIGGTPSFQTSHYKYCRRNTHHDIQTPHSINRITPHNNSDDSNHPLHGTMQKTERDSSFRNTANQRIQQTVPRTKSMFMVAFCTFGTTFPAM